MERRRSMKSERAKHAVRKILETAKPEDRRALLEEAMKNLEAREVLASKSEGNELYSRTRGHLPQAMAQLQARKLETPNFMRGEAIDEATVSIPTGSVAAQMLGAAATPVASKFPPVSTDPNYILTSDEGRARWSDQLRQVAELVVIDSFNAAARQMSRVPRNLQREYVDSISRGDPQMQERAREVLRESRTRGHLTAEQVSGIEDEFKRHVATQCDRYVSSIKGDDLELAGVVTRGINVGVRESFGEMLKLVATTTTQIEDVARLERELQALGITREEARADYLRHKARLDAIAKVARELPTPPLKTAANVEAASMGYTHVMCLLGTGDVRVRDEELTETINRFGYSSDPAITRLRFYYADLVEKISPRELSAEIASFLGAWRTCAFARLEIGHKLAAALCLTDVHEDPEHPIKMPWPAFSFVVPDGLLENVARIWVHSEKKRVHILDRSGKRWEGGGPELKNMIANLVCGAALALSDPDEFKKERHHGATHAGTKKHRRDGAPDLDQARYMLSAPVTIDMREHVTGTIRAEREGRKYSSPTVQFLVRGHWKNQVHGPGRSLRKRIWLQPFWKGPEELRILLRSHKVVDDEPPAQQ